MSIDAETLQCFRACVDQSQAMDFASLETELRQWGVWSTCPSSRNLGAIESHLSVNEIVLAHWCKLIKVEISIEQARYDVGIVGMIPI